MSGGGYKPGWPGRGDPRVGMIPRSCPFCASYEKRVVALRDEVAAGDRRLGIAYVVIFLLLLALGFVFWVR